ncbi:MAG TPA: LLM class flavin-dependent oxidoreductase [Nitrososphaerales archaeon]|nr:LLM class flavin-dependent oxidoreductase [Nitrososphaerales archaeon]
MKVGAGFNVDVPVSEIVKHSAKAEQLGLESLWLHEHSFSRDALSYLNSVAGATSRLRVGVACLTPYTRHPLVLAMSMFTLQECSKGRAVLGLGTGFPMRLDLMGIKHEKPIAELKETIEICRKVWSGESVNYSGKIFSLKNVKSIPGKAVANIPIYIAGWKRQMLWLTGKYADGYVAKGGESTRSLARIVSDIAVSAERNSRKIQDLEVAAYMLTFVSDSKSEALASARKDYFVNYMLSVQDDYLYEETGINPESKKPVAENFFKGNLAESSSHVTDEMLDAFTVCGTEDNIRDRLLEYEKSGLNLAILQPISMKYDDVTRVLNAGSKLISEEMIA